MLFFKKKRFKFFLATFTIYYLISNIQPIMATSMSSSQYKLDTNISNVYKETHDNADNPKQEPQQAIPQQTNSSIYIGENYKLIYPADNSLLVLSISPTLVDYGILSPNNSVKRANTISILSKYPNGYTVNAIQNHRLRNNSEAEIPNTSCDTGVCSVKEADVWNNSLTYGFGYRCDDLFDISSCPNDFSNTDYYKRFPNISESHEPYQLIRQSTPINSKARITYQLNVSRSQEEGHYSNSIIFMAIPNF